MPKYRRGRGAARDDLWTIAGGVDSILKSLLSLDILSQNTAFNSDIWSRLATELFGNDSYKNRHWLYVVWSYNRRNVRRNVELQKQLKNDSSATISENKNTDNRNKRKKDSSEISSDEHTLDQKHEEETSGIECASPVRTKCLILGRRKVGRNKGPENVQCKTKLIYQDHEKQAQNLTFCTEGQSMNKNEEESWSHGEIPDHIESEVSDNFTEHIQRVAEEKSKMESEEESVRSGVELTMTKLTTGHVKNPSINLSCEEKAFTGCEYDTSEWSEDSMSEPLECERPAILEVTPKAKMIAESGKKLSDVKKQLSEDIYRKLPPVPAKFRINVSPKQWKKIAPMKGFHKLRHPWTQFLYTEFKKQNPCCPLHFTYQHVRIKNSRKRHAPYLTVHAICKFSTCKARYSFEMQEKPTVLQSCIKLAVRRTGPICHLKRETRFRPASNIRRGRIARAVLHGVSQEYYRRLSATPVKEIVSGNLTESLNKDVLKAIAAEFRKGRQLHENVLIEMSLTQSILSECDSNFYSTPGYIQHLQTKPFGTHMYTEVGISILVQHLRKRTPLSLYLDATGGVVSKIPEQSKRVLYYSLTLAGKGRDAPPLPICEMLTNEHSVPPISFWLMQFLLKLSKYSSLRVHRVESDYSWAMMQAVLLAFNRENIDVYLERTHAILSKTKTWAEIKSFTVLHLCSAHVIKAVTCGIGRKTDDRDLKDFTTYVFARLQNTVKLEVAKDIFRNLCTVLLTEKSNERLRTSLQYLKALIANERIPQLEQSSETDESKVWEDDTEKKFAKTIMGRSPYSKDFRKVFAEVKNAVNIQKDDVGKENDYHCHEILDFLLDNYMAIFPLWSGVLLGDLRRYASDKEYKGSKTDLDRTRDTNCQVENWFGIVKNSILQKRRNLRPAEFIRKMYSSLRGRYTEHIMRFNLPDDLLVKPMRPMKNLTFAEESWAKRDDPPPKDAGKAKYYSAPKTALEPKRKNKGAKKNVDTDSSKHKKKIVPRCDPKPETKKAALFEKKEVDIPNSELEPKEKVTVTAKALHSSSFKQKETQAVDFSKQVETLWQAGNTEIVVSVVRSSDQKFTSTLRHADFVTLRPHELLDGEVMECYIQATLNNHCKAGRLFQLNHYISGVILHGTREQMARQSLKNVNFESFCGIISFVNVNNNHWKFVYLHALSGQIFVVDPAAGQKDIEDSRQAATKYQNYFRMRLNKLGKSEWVNIKWKPGKIQHTVQNDATSCGVFVMQMAKKTIEEFPNVPAHFNIDSTESNIRSVRGQMAETILSASDPMDEYCSICGLKEFPRSTNTEAVIIDWTQCETCERWFHDVCIALQEKFDRHLPWHCVLCRQAKKK